MNLVLSFLTKVKSGSEAKSKQSYAYGDVLSFLIPVMKKRKTTGNMDSLENINIFDESNNDSCDGENSISQKKKKDQNNLDFQNTLVEFIKNPPLKPPEEFDADKAFLLSFLPDLKKMNDTQKLDLKIEFMNAVKRIITPPQSNNDIYQRYTDYSNQQNLTNHQIHQPSNAFLPHF
ncbi:uncharacterized protein LOC132926200 [Rhopalosiphum padi]|uniref:uncharacterized protein LOC132926200 n=1 Tax=Rhopalosiphum padi TaxID=40932 RepID=UPI00298EA40A|nr:uncharacterized protein LOC132926200 [Rhopalosiphum padi]